MDNKEIYYGINLDDYWYPKRMRNKKGYVGTKEDLEWFAKRLKESCWNDKQKCGVSKVIRSYMDGTLVEGMAEKNGVSLADMHCLEVIHRSELITLEHHSWQYKAANDSIYPLYADYVNVERIIVKEGNNIYTAIKGAMAGLLVCIQGTGWVAMRGHMSGYPQTVTYDPQEGLYELSMFVVDSVVSPRELDNVIQKLAKVDVEELNYMCQDIIAEGEWLTAEPRDYLP